MAAVVISSTLFIVRFGHRIGTCFLVFTFVFHCLCWGAPNPRFKGHPHLQIQKNPESHLVRAGDLTGVWSTPGEQGAHVLLIPGKGYQLLRVENQSVISVQQLFPQVFGLTDPSGIELISSDQSHLKFRIQRDLVHFRYSREGFFPAQINRNEIDQNQNPWQQLEKLSGGIYQKSTLLQERFLKSNSELGTFDWHPYQDVIHPSTLNSLTPHKPSPFMVPPPRIAITLDSEKLTIVDNLQKIFERGIIDYLAGNQTTFSIDLEKAFRHGLDRHYDHMHELVGVSLSQVGTRLPFQLPEFNQYYVVQEPEDLPSSKDLTLLMLDLNRILQQSVPLTLIGSFSRGKQKEIHRVQITSANHTVVLIGAPCSDLLSNPPKTH